MSFRDDVQLARACDALCRRVRTPACWVVTIDGKGASATTYAVDVRDGKVGLSHGERLIVLAAWAFWNGGDNKLPFAELIETLSNDQLEAIFSLALARSEGAAAVDRWLEKNEGFDRTRRGAGKAGAL